MSLNLPSKNPDLVKEGIYKTDLFNFKKLFRVKNNSKNSLNTKYLYVRSWDEAYALHGSANLDDINLSYLCRLISGCSSSLVSPYKNIQRLARGSNIKINRDGSYSSEKYDVFEGGANAMGEKKLYEFINKKFTDNLKSNLSKVSINSNVGCEHSSGLDSNSILGGLVKGLKVPNKKIFTMSFESHGEGKLLKLFREYYCVEKSNIKSFKDTLRYSEQNQDKDCIVNEILKFGAPFQLQSFYGGFEFFKKNFCVLTFSGLGGDQALSHSGANIPTNLIQDNAFRELIIWAGGVPRALKFALLRSSLLMFDFYKDRLVNSYRNSFVKYKCYVFLKNSLSNNGHNLLDNLLFYDEFPNEYDIYCPLSESIKKRISSEWVSVRAEQESRIANSFGMNIYFPFLDQYLINTLLNQNYRIFSEGIHRGRLVNRMSFKKYLPETLFSNPSKKRDHNSEILIEKFALKDLEMFLDLADNWHTKISDLWLLDHIKSKVYKNLSAKNTNSDNVLTLRRAMEILNKLSNWFELLEG